jgi:putative transposase
MDSVLRPDVPGMPCHLWVRGNNRLPCFIGDEDRRIYLSYLAESAESFSTEVHAFVLMTNHVHLLVTGREPRSISRFMQQVNRRYSRYFNKAHDRTGTLYEGRFGSSHIESERYFFTAMPYIESNPVRAGLVRHPGDYPWSSHRQNASGAPDGLLTPHPLFIGLGGDPASRARAYLALFDLPEDEEALKVIRLGKVI